MVGGESFRYVMSKDAGKIFNKRVSRDWKSPPQQPCTRKSCSDRNLGFGGQPAMLRRSEGLGCQLFDL